MYCTVHCTAKFSVSKNSQRRKFEILSFYFKEQSPKWIFLALQNGHTKFVVLSLHFIFKLIKRGHFPPPQDAKMFLKFFLKMFPHFRVTVQISWGPAPIKKQHLKVKFRNWGPIKIWHSFQSICFFFLKNHPTLMINGASIVQNLHGRVRICAYEYMAYAHCTPF